MPKIDCLCPKQTRQNAMPRVESSVAPRQCAVVLGASQGLGQALVLSLARRGFAVVAASRNVARLNQIALDCNRMFPDSCCALCADVTSRESLHALMSQAVARFGSISVLVINAGVNHDACIADWTSTDDFEQVLMVNTVGPVRALHSALPYLVRSGGLVVALTSMAGVLGAVPGGVAYACSKAGLDACFQSLGPELKQLGVRTLIVEPGSFRADDFTPRQILADANRYAGARSGKKLRTATEVANRIVDAIAAGQEGRLWSSYRAFTFVGLGLKLFAPSVFARGSLRARFSDSAPPTQLVSGERARSTNADVRGG
jgi:NAD(P)-dependent dehydrogenase (short-subunit alcohol dehydrogenase family)